MAVVAHTPYTGNADCGRTNEYICDGHGLPPVDRTNRYISDGHGGHTICEGYNCPADPQLATEYMNTIRLNYERQHPPGEGRTKGTVTHEQIYVSPTEEDNVPPEERMQMMRELIERTPLRDFPSIYCPHDNTPDKHGHISVCPFSIPDQDGKQHKLCLNNSMLNDLRREMDRICVEHGYSIVENPELWSDKEYRDWFFMVKEEGLVKIHPPKEKHAGGRGGKRAKEYAASKKEQARRMEEAEAEYRKLTKGYKAENAHLFYELSYLPNPQMPDTPMRIKRRGKDGRELGELEMTAAMTSMWASSTAKELERRNIKGSTGMIKRMHTFGFKAMKTAQLMKDLDIHTHDELIAQIKEVGCDIADLKQDVKRQNTIMERMADVMDHIDRWENEKDSAAHEWLKAHHCGTAEQIADAKKRYRRATARKATSEALLEDRSKEYRHLKEAEKTLEPASSEELWQEYVGQMFTKEYQKRIGFTDAEKITKQLRKVGKVAGLPPEEIDRLLSNARETAEETTWVEYRTFMRMTWEQDDTVGQIYDEIKDAYDDLRRLRELSRATPVIGPLTFILALALAIYAGYQSAAKESEIAQLKWEAEIMKGYAKQTQRERTAKMNEAKSIYDEEVAGASEAEVQAARVRFYRTAAEIVGRMDIVNDIDQMKRSGTLDSKIEDAVKRQIDPQTKHIIREHSW